MCFCFCLCGLITLFQMIVRNRRATRNANDNWEISEAEFEKGFGLLIGGPLDPYTEM